MADPFLESLSQPGPGRGAIVATQRPPAAPQGWENVWDQTKRLASGAAGIVSNAGKVLSLPMNPGPGIEAANNLMSGVKNMAVVPIRELSGLDAQGNIPKQPRTMWDRPFDAAWSVLGGDPDTAHERDAAGDTVGRLAALYTAPAETFGLGKLLGLGIGAARARLAPGAAPLGMPATVSSNTGTIAAMRDAVPVTKTVSGGDSAMAEMAHRAAAPGQYLPAEFERVNRLASVHGLVKSTHGPKEKLIQDVLPYLDDAIRTDGVTPPRGIAETDGIIQRLGTGVRSGETLMDLYRKTMGIQERKYQEILGPAKGDPIPTGAMYQAIGDALDPGVRKLAEHADDLQAAARQSGGTIPMPKTIEAQTFRDAVEAARAPWLKGNGDFTLGDLEDIRHYSYQAEKQGRAGRIDSRTKPDYMIDEATLKGANKLLYDDLQQRATAAGKPPDYIRKLKEVQSKLYDLMDSLDPAAAASLNEESFRRGTNLLQRMNVTAALHPETMSMVASAHGLKSGLVGEAKDMASINQKIRRTFAQKGVPNTKAGGVVQGIIDLPGKPLARQAAVGSIPDRRRQQEAPPHVLPTPEDAARFFGFGPLTGKPPVTPRAWPLNQGQPPVTGAPIQTPEDAARLLGVQP